MACDSVGAFPLQVVPRSLEGITSRRCSEYRAASENTTPLPYCTLPYTLVNVIPERLLQACEFSLSLPHTHTYHDPCVKKKKPSLFTHTHTHARTHARTRVI